MRFLDIAVATVYAAVCLSVILLTSPVAPREAASDAAAQASLDSAISAFMDRVGLPLLATSSIAAICSSAAQSSNSTLGIGVLLGGAGCGPPPWPLASSSLSLDLAGRTVVIEAWLARR